MEIQFAWTVNNGIQNNKRRCQDKGSIHKMQTLKPFVDFIIACFTFNKRKNESAMVRYSLCHCFKWAIYSPRFVACFVSYQVTFEIVRRKIDFVGLYEMFRGILTTYLKFGFIIYCFSCLLPHLKIEIKFVQFIWALKLMSRSGTFLRAAVCLIKQNILCYVISFLIHRH